MPGHWVEGSALKESTASGDGVIRRKRPEMLPGTSPPRSTLENSQKHRGYSEITLAGDPCTDA